MQWILLIIAVVVAYNVAFQKGKSLGSRKGYGVGFDRGRRSRTNASGCAVVVAAAGLALAAATRVLAWF